MKFKIERMGSDGEGIAFHKGKPVYIYYAYLGERVEASLYTNKRGVFEANLIEVLKPSPERIDVAWPHYMNSGSTNLMHINYLAQLKYKRNEMIFLQRTKLRNETKNTKLELTLPSPKEFNYRNKSFLPLVYSDGKNRIANYLRGSNKLFVVDSLVIEDEVIEQVSLSVLNLMNKNNVNAYDRKTRKGSVIALSIRVNKKGEAQLSFVTKVRIDLKPLVKDIKKALPNVVSIYENYTPKYKNSSDTHEGELTLLSGSKYLEMEINNYKFYLTPHAFFQLNTLQAERLYNLIIEKAKLKQDDLVLDAYCGVGTIATHISKYVDQVVAIESVKAAVKDMNYSLEVNGIKNVKTITGDFVKIVSYLKQDFDKMIFNPPRIGLGEEVCNYVLKFLPKQVIYVSCNPKTLVSDLQILSKRYSITSITPVDMFPQTAHIENLVVLDLKQL